KKGTSVKSLIFTSTASDEVVSDGEAADTIAPDVTAPDEIAPVSAGTLTDDTKPPEASGEAGSGQGVAGAAEPAGPLDKRALLAGAEPRTASASAVERPDETSDAPVAPGFDGAAVALAVIASPVRPENSSEPLPAGTSVNEGMASEKSGRGASV